MIKRKLLLLFLGMASLAPAWAQRTVDKLDRGLVAVKTSGGIYCSWRILGEEYYDVQYNIYRDGTKLNSAPLSVSNFTDKGGTTSSKYTVEPVVRGVAQTKSAAVSPWANNYKEIKMNHGSLTSTYTPNDACVADVDGDGELEILLKFDNNSDANNRYMPGGYNGEYAIVEVYKLDGTKLWWLDFGPNMGDFQNNENNIVAYDWDMDGKAEALLRAADGTKIHAADGKVYTIGNASKNYRSSAGGGGANWFMHEGDEFLVYVNGETGVPYVTMEYPLKRLEAGETDLSKAWGDGYGHRSTKHFFGAPYLDGRKPSIFLGRGIYTRHKFVALDVDPATHKLTERWRWTNNQAGSPWYGQGFHNYCISDVDWDGRDEIVFGALVIDDNGKGLSTTGLGHGDAQHAGDFDPFTHGQEIFTCQEESPNNCFRDGTTAKIYYRTIGGADDGRSMMDNFVDDIPGAQGVSAKDGALISSVTHAAVDGTSKGGVSITQNFRIYWDGDLCSESFNYANGKNTEGAIYKGRGGLIATLSGSMTNNDTKGTPCYQGDILGDWREEVIMRTANGNIRIYTTDIETPWRNYTLWHDHQYRNAMVWQMCGYNQPPHVSYFMGQLEGITRTPAPLTMTGRTEIKKGATIGSAHNDKHIILCEAADATVSVTNGATPYIFTVNTPTWVQGSAPSEATKQEYDITTTTYTHTVTGGAFGGTMRLVKQGDGILNLPNVTETYSGPTEVWGGVLNFDGTLQNSRLWLNRFAELNSDGGNFAKGIEMNYASVLRPGGTDKKGTVTTDSLILNYGATLEMDLYSDGLASDLIKVNTLKIDKKDWNNAPEFVTPVLRFNAHPAAGAELLATGRYLIAEVQKVDGDIKDIKVVRIAGLTTELVLEGTKLYIVVGGMRGATDVTWTGAAGSTWDVANTENFKLSTGDADVFAEGDKVTFDDSAVSGNVNLTDELSPASVVFNNNTLEYTIGGKSITGAATLVKNGDGKTTINNINTFTGGTTVNGGKLVVTSLANNEGADYGSLGGESASITVQNGGTLSVSGGLKTTQPITVGEGGATIDVPSGSSLNVATIVKSSAKAPVYKTGAGELRLSQGNTFGKLYLNQGSIACVTSTSSSERLIGDTLVFNGSGVTVYHDDTQGLGGPVRDNTNYSVPAGKSGHLWLDGRCDYYGGLAGSGSLSVHPRFVRNYLHGNWDAFTGTVRICPSSKDSYSVQLGNGASFANSTIYLEAGGILANEGVSIKVGSIDGTGTISGSGTVTITTDDNFNFKGTISSPVVKTGKGRWTVTSSAPQTGSTKISINGGTLFIDSYSTDAVVNSVTVNEGGAIAGMGVANTIVLEKGATAVPGDSYGLTGGLVSTGTFNVKAGSTVKFNIADNGNTEYSRSFIQGKNMFMNGTVEVLLDPAYTPAVGDEIILWTATNYTGTPTFNMPALPVTMEWDTTGLTGKTGKLKIIARDPAGISTLNASTAARCRMFTTGGILVGEFDATASEVNAKARALGAAPGTYIVKMTDGSAARTVKVVVK